MEIKLLVTVQVDPDGDKEFDERELKNTAAEAISNAISMGENAGFSHQLASEVSVGLVGVEIMDD